MEPVSSTSGSNAQHSSMWDVQTPKSYDSEETMSEGLFATKKNPDTYEKTEISLELR